MTSNLESRIRRLESAEGRRMIFVLTGPRNDQSREVESALADGVRYVRAGDESEAEFKHRVSAAVLVASRGATLVWLDQEDEAL